ncbi:hypothetical protein Pcar_3263 [Syntrophotalea carbinolica DSM 2380]|uniref:Uncharacterized protein n=1 Tax=Syntrophotalea carbinolica (strain DSM 2380 / NBRC 103641 / GraBd1) TaxID=338963 RepID=Q0C6Q4_SYNC1|nr:hypothetical protein Pcar_3263 [Syntrophotalea carbinolica DSM 2380]
MAFINPKSMTRPPASLHTLPLPSDENHFKPVQRWAFGPRGYQMEHRTLHTANQRAVALKLLECSYEQSNCRLCSIMLSSVILGLTSSIMQHHSPMPDVTPGTTAKRPSKSRMHAI